MDARYKSLQTWLAEQLSSDIQLTPIVGDASFRRYFRVTDNHNAFIAMDSPPHLEDPVPFVAIARTFTQLGLQVPTIPAANLQDGYLLISDLGDDLYLSALNANSADNLYTLAMKELDIIQSCQTTPGWNLPAFNETFMLTELNNCKEWFFEKHLNLSLNNSEQLILNNVIKLLLQSATEQPQCCVHRDYHSRNLMVLSDQRVGILDFQDAVWGPMSYDIISLLRDCYISWPVEQVNRWALTFYEQRRAAGALQKYSAEQFMRWFDLMGMQRHMKCLFIFSRKFHRDGTRNYLSYLPRTLNYLTTVSANYPEFKSFHAWLSEEITPRLHAAEVITQ